MSLRSLLDLIYIFLRGQNREWKKLTFLKGSETKMKNEDRLWIHVIYKHPKDFPDKYVVRRQSPNSDGTILAATNCIVGSTLEGVREMLEDVYPGLVRIARHPQDDSVIVESWI